MHWWNKCTSGLCVCVCVCVCVCPTPQMEGANLYDVFQRISKGDYEALPDHMFSPTLKRLVECMLSVDPAGG